MEDSRRIDTDEEEGDGSGEVHYNHTHDRASIDPHPLVDRERAEITQGSIGLLQVSQVVT